MPFVLSILFTACVVAAGVWSYRRMLPRPIAGIPYKSASARPLLGDLPDVCPLECLSSLMIKLTEYQASKWRQQTGEMWSYVRQRALELNSPIFQMFMSGPAGKPWVVIADFWESYDLQMNRQGEFDRSTFLADVFGPLLPGNHVWVRSKSLALGRSADGNLDA